MVSRKAGLFILFFLIFYNFTFAQNVDSSLVVKPKDSIASPLPDSIKINLHSPKKAAMYSAILPGLGQAYNKKYWKIPIVWGAMAFSIFYVDSFNRSYKNYKNRFDLKNRTIPTSYNSDSSVSIRANLFPNESLEFLKGNRDIARRNRDLFIIITTGIYILNIIDASVDAHLFYFDVSDDLSLKVLPDMYYNPNINGWQVNAFSLKIKL